MTTFRPIRDETPLAAKRRAMATGRTLGAVVETALADWLERERTAPPHPGNPHREAGVVVVSEGAGRGWPSPGRPL
jgi:hypothetical protein